MESKIASKNGEREWVKNEWVSFMIFIERKMENGRKQSERGVMLCYFKRKKMEKWELMGLYINITRTKNRQTKYEWICIYYVVQLSIEIYSVESWLSHK